MAIEFCTREYRFSHGKEPRGYGSWAFFFDRKFKIEDAFWVNQSTYGDAKKAARAEAKRRNVGIVFVGS